MLLQARKRSNPTFIITRQTDVVAYTQMLEWAWCEARFKLRSGDLSWPVFVFALRVDCAQIEPD